MRKAITRLFTVAALAVLTLPQMAVAQSLGNVPIRRAADNKEKVANLLKTKKSQILHRVDSIQGDNTTIWVNLQEMGSSYPQDYISYALGVYSVQASSSNLEFTALATNSNLSGKNGATFFDNSFHYINSVSYYGMSSYYYGEYSTEDWTETVAYNYNSNVSAISNTASTYDPTTGNVYAFKNNKTLEIIDYSSFTATEVKIFNDTSFISLAANAQGELYAISSNGGLHKIDKTTGDDTYIGYTGVDTYSWSSNQGSAFDMKTGKLYWAAWDNNTYRSKLYQVDVQTGRASYINTFSKQVHIGSIYVPAPAAEDGAPAKVSDLKANFTAPSKTGTVTFTLPTKTFDGTADLTGDITYYLTVNNDTLATGSEAPGTAITKDITFETSGSKKFLVTTYNSVGKSPNASTTQWVGYDEPYAVSWYNQSDDGNGKVSLSWSPVTSVKNGGYMGTITYRVVRMPKEEIVADQLDTTAFVDQLPDTVPMSLYWYRLYAVNGDMQSTACEQSYNKIAYGSAFDIPWYCSFESSDSLNFFTRISQYSWYNSTDYDYQTGNSKGVVQTYDDDAWLLTPPLKMEGGREYSLSYSYKGSSANAWSKASAMLVAFGQGVDTTAYRYITDTLTLDKTDYQNSTYTVRVYNDGEYRFAFHAVSPSGTQIILDSLHVWAGALFAAPDTVTNLTMNPTLGEYKADITFNAPATNGGGEALSSLDYILVKSGNQLIDSIANPTPGQTYTSTDTTPFSGTRSYSVTAYNSFGAGSTAHVSGYYGDDVPLPPTNKYWQFGKELGLDLSCTDNNDGTITVSWHKPEATGVNGRPVNLDHIYYNVKVTIGAQTGGRSDTAYVVSGDTTYTITGLPTTGPQKDVYITVTSQNLAGESGTNTYNYELYCGAPYELPIHDGFDESNPSDYHWYTRYFDKGTAYSADDDEPGSLYLLDNRLSIVESAKVSIKDAKNPKVAFSLYMQKPASGENSGTVSIIQFNNGRTVPYVMKQVSNDSFPENGGWQRVIVPLTSNNSGYSFIRFEVTPSGESSPVAIDNIDIYDMPSYDLSARLTGQKSVRVNHEGKFNVRVSNRGDQTATGYTVNLLNEKDSIVATAEGSDLASGGEQTYTLVYTPAAGETGEESLHAVVEFASDEDLTNNADTIALTVTESEYPGVDNLKGEATDNTATITWDAPENAIPSLIEDFEDYEAFTANMGEWTLRDADASEQTYGFSDVTFTGMYGPMSYIIFNPSVFGDPTGSVFQAPSGDQYAISFAAVPSTTAEAQSDDWLISPELSGREQTITYKTGILTASYPETFDVMYSTTDTARASFQTLETKRVTSAGFTDMESILPEDARYFALRHTTADGFSLAFDDINYEGAAQEVTAYNIYRDGEVVATVPAGTTEYAVSSADASSHTFAVSAVYGSNESVLETVTFTVVDAIDNVSAIATDNITSVFTTNGVVAGKSNADFNRLPAGVYIVRTAEGKTVKVTKK